MKNKKGFVFVETIVVCSVLAISLVTIYASFVLLINNYKKRDKFNQAIYNYRLYNVAKALSDVSIGQCAYEEMKNIENNGSNLYSDKLNNLYNNFQITTLYRVRSGDVLKRMPLNYNRLSEFTNTIATSDDNDCLLIGEFKNNDEYYYSFMFLTKKD